MIPYSVTLQSLQRKEEKKGQLCTLEVFGVPYPGSSASLPQLIGCLARAGMYVREEQRTGVTLLALVAFLYFSVIINLKNSESTYSLSDGVEFGALDFSVFILACSPSLKEAQHVFLLLSLCSPNPH